MDIKPTNEIMRELLRLYRKSKSKESWQVITGRNPKGRYDTFISADDKLWQLETEPIGSMEFIGVGSEITNVDEDIRKIMRTGSPVPFGIISPQRGKFSIIMAGIEQYSSDSVHLLRKEYFSEEQIKLEEKLNQELKRLVNRNPSFARKYKEQKEHESKSYM
ncbi:MAG: hypothetical protein HY929_07100 [Euryarchaeota archaeon]|nr:hypothetical protein [Euryarchaeota archaeon]